MMAIGDPDPNQPWNDATGYSFSFTAKMHALIQTRVNLGYDITQMALAANLDDLLYNGRRQDYEDTREAWMLNVLNPDAFKNNAPQTFLASLKAYRSRIHDAWLVLIGRAEINV